MQEILKPEELKVDSVRLNSLINNRQNRLYDLGYLSATYKISKIDQSNVEIEYYAGLVFSMVHLSQGNVSDEIMNKIGFKTIHYNKKPFSNRRVVKLFRNILDYAENHGYPFAAIKLDSIKIEKNEISAWINYESGPLIVFDSLTLNGFEKVKASYLMTHLGIYRGKAYEEKLIKEISNKIKLLPFVSLTSEPEITIKNEKCNIGLQLVQNKVSEIDGIIGVLPNQREDNKLLVTGQVLLHLKNLFSSGKRIRFEWQSYDAESQLLNILYYHPNLFRTPINIQGSFDLLKQDTSFLNRNFLLDLSLISKNSSTIAFKSDFFSSRLISTTGLENINELPENSDFNINYYGLDYSWIRFDDPFLPRKGWSLAVAGSVGQKKILKNAAFPDDVYEDINLKSIQYKMYGAIEKFWPVYRNLVLRTSLEGAYLSGSNLFLGDLYRIGGLRSLRGFAEKSFYASGYGVLNLEARALFAGQTYLMVFFDSGYIINDLNIANKEQFPFGAGAGLSFSTGAGIFNLVFALGKSATQPFSFSHSKIHFGYVSRF